MSYLKLEYSTSFNPQNSNSAKFELEKPELSYYSTQNSKYSSKIRAWYMFELSSLKLDGTRSQ